MENSGVEFYKRVKHGYLEIAKSSDRFIIIDGMKKIDEISEQIWYIVFEKLKMKAK
ncbi:hypothetical protein JGI2_00433 [Candidatus Kryptobacter tengchongensis]|nr:hypothetical protein JGI2_00433 [Candidatus Kryptobacter tengchongensis]